MRYGSMRSSVGATVVRAGGVERSGCGARSGGAGSGAKDPYERNEAHQNSVLIDAGTVRARGAAGGREVFSARRKVAVRPTVGGEYGKCLGAAGASQGGKGARYAKRPKRITV